MNSVTLRDANPPPQLDGFSEEFAECLIASFVGFLAGYDHAPLAVQSRDLAGRRHLKTSPAVSLTSTSK